MPKIRDFFFFFYIRPEPQPHGLSAPAQGLSAIHRSILPSSYATISWYYHHPRKKIRGNSQLHPPTPPPPQTPTRLLRLRSAHTNFRSPKCRPSMLIREVPWLLFLLIILSLQRRAKQSRKLLSVPRTNKVNFIVRRASDSKIKSGL